MTQLHAAGLVKARDEPARKRGGRGRPTPFWQLTARRPCAISEHARRMRLQRIKSVIQVFGAAATEQLRGARKNPVRAHYEAALGGARSQEHRLRLLAELRTRECYMAEVQAHGSDFLLVENHCPIYTAAKACTGLCASELRLFAEVLEPQVEVERVDHVLQGARRCANRGTQRAPR